MGFRLPALGFRIRVLQELSTHEGAEDAVRPFIALPKKLWRTGERISGPPLRFQPGLRSAGGGGGAVVGPATSVPAGIKECRGACRAIRACPAEGRCLGVEAAAAGAVRRVVLASAAVLTVGRQH